MFGILKKEKKAEKVNLFAVAETLNRRLWNYEMVEGQPNTIVINGKYRNRQRDFYKLYVNFCGEKVRFSDERGSLISEVSKTKMYPELKDIMNVL